MLDGPYANNTWQGKEIGILNIEAGKAGQVPQVSITVDGVNLTIPQQPLLSTNLNGYTMNNHYQVYGRMTDNSVIKATWNGVTKVFLIN